MTAGQDMATLSQRSLEVRRRCIQIRQQIRSGDLALTDVLLNPPPELETWAIIDVVRVARGVSRYRSPEWVQRMGRAASQNGVNLMMPLGSASLRTREWVAEYADWGRHRTRGARPRVVA